MMKLEKSFFCRDVLEVAPQLLGCTLVRQLDPQTQLRYVITETEAYRGEDDLACHASKGRTTRTDIMYAEGGKVYVYLIYGMHWLLNIVTGPSNHPQAVLIRALQTINGPGKIGKALQLNKTFYGEDLTHSSRIWIESSPKQTTPKYITSPRININYATDYWRNIHWRFNLID
jgi:DNA-3-methyladenine glycosylase